MEYAHFQSSIRVHFPASYVSYVGLPERTCSKGNMSNKKTKMKQIAHGTLWTIKNNGKLRGTKAAGLKIEYGSITPKTYTLED